MKCKRILCAHNIPGILDLNNPSYARLQVLHTPCSFSGEDTFTKLSS
jgi:hypothetical protein